MALVSVFAGMGVGLASAMKPHLAKSLAIPYALIEGVLLGTFSLIMYRYLPIRTIICIISNFYHRCCHVDAVCHRHYQSYRKFRAIVTSAVIAIGILYLVQLGFHLFGSSLPLLFDGVWLPSALVFCDFDCVV